METERVARRLRRETIAASVVYMDLRTLAREALASFLSNLPRGKGSRLVILCDSDADGLPAAALLVRALHAAGYEQVTAQARRKTETAWTPAVLERLRAAAPEALFVLDLGSRPEPLLPGIPALLIDHHAPYGVPENGTLLTGYGTEPTPTTGLLVYWSVAGLVTDAAREGWLWLAAISLLSDLGEKAPFPELTEARARCSLKSLREATSLLNAPRRTASGDARFALSALLHADGPEQIARGDLAESEHLLEAKAEVAAALAEAKKGAPRFSQKFRDTLGADLVAIRMHTPCQVHPLVAQLWRGRFRNSVIFGVNTGFRSGWVHFSGRAPKGVHLLRFLREHAPPEAGEGYGSGHDQASGGALPTEVWNRFAAELGFGPEMEVAPDGPAVEDTNQIAASPLG